LNIHGNYNKEKNLFKNPLGYFYDTNLKLAKKIIVPSVYLKNILKLNQAVIIPNFLKRFDFKNNKAKRNYVRLILVSHFAFKEKSMGVLEVVKSLTFLKTDKPIVLDIFGNGRYFELVKRMLTKIYLPKNIKVRFKGYSTHIYDELASSDIFVYWSGLDNVPMVIMEAMMVGLPIITNDFPSFKDEIKINNFCCSSKKEFANSIDLLINDKKLREKISAKNIVYAKRFLPENSVAKFIKEIYEE
jgi:glycosyltransferase involved in cell wall biosynthesis